MAHGAPSPDITPIGYHNFRGNSDQKFGIKLSDRRRHIYVIGKTGVGKSTLLENMAIDDIRSGKGMAFIDPHGQSAELLLDFIPEERLDDVIYFDPADMEFPIAFNPMEQVGNEFRHLVASGIMGVFKKIWVDAWSARMEYILNNTLLALLELPSSTILGVLRMFAEPEYRKKIVANLQDPVIKAFWQNEFARYSQKLETEALAAIQNKVGQFVSNPLIRNILGQARSTINMRDIMDSGKIFIANLSKGKMGEDNSALLGAMIISRLQLAAMSRVDVPESQRRDFFMYVDEFQNFATDSFASILSEARKYHLSLTLAHQYIGQLVTNDGNSKVRDAVFGNVGTLISFRVGAADGEFLEKEFMPEFLQNDLVNLPMANIYIKLMIDGISSKPFSATTLPPQISPLQSYKDIIIKNTREHYGTPRKIVEERIASEWAQESDTAISEKLGRRNERPLSQVLRADGRPNVQRAAPRFAAPQGAFPPAGPSAPNSAPLSAPPSERSASGAGTRTFRESSEAPRSAPAPREYSAPRPEAHQQQPQPLQQPVPPTERSHPESRPPFQSPERPMADAERDRHMNVVRPRSGSSAVAQESLPRTSPGRESFAEKQSGRPVRSEAIRPQAERPRFIPDRKEEAEALSDTDEASNEASERIMADEPSAVRPHASSAPAPKQFVRQKVDIEEMRRSIMESLKKKKEQEKGQEKPPTQISTEPPGSHQK